jgi:hypothetical protein
LLTALGLGSLNPRLEIISLLGKKEVDLGVAKIQGTKLPEAGIPSITATSMLYREGDTAHLTIIWVGKANSEAAIEVKIGNQRANEVPIKLDEYGMAEHRIASLSQGDYTVSIKGTSASTFFKVASHELAAFDAQLIKSQLQKNDILSFEVHFQTHGVPFEGQVIAQLQSNGQNVGDPVEISSDKNGVAKGEIKLQGKGELTINFQVKDDPGKIASVLVKGAKEEARKPFQINQLGEVIEISTMELKSGRNIRGLSVRETGEINETPLRISQVINETTNIQVKEKCKVVKLVMINLATGESQEYEYRDENIPRVINEPISKPGVAIYLALAAILEDGRYWEGESTLIYPEKFSLEITSPEKVEPGEEVEIGFNLSSLNGNGIPDKVPVGVVVRDSRLTAIDPGTALAASLKARIETSAIGKIGYSKNLLSEIAPRRPFYIIEIEEIGALKRFTGSQALTLSAIPAESSKNWAPAELKFAKTTTSVAVAESELEIDFSQLPVIRQTDKAPEVVYAGRICLKNGKGSLKITLPQGAANYVVEAVAVDKNLDWQSASASFLATKDLIGELDLPEFVHPEDQAEGRLTVTCQSRQFKVKVTLNGKSLELRKGDGSEIQPDTIFEDLQAEVFFAVQAGKIRASIEDVRSGKIDILEKTVHEPGKLEYQVHLTQLLQPGQTVTIEDFPGATEITVQPGLEQSADKLAQSTASYPHGCCEQTATGILAAVSMYLGSSNGNQAKAEEYILAGIEREKRMWLKGKGFKMYPERGNIPDTHYGPQAALRLLSLKDIENLDDLSPALAKAVREGLEMAYDACKAYKLETVPSTINSCQDAYRACSNGSNLKSEALTFVKSRLQDYGDGVYVKDGGRVNSRAQTAYAAATLLLSGRQSEIPLAIQAINWLTSQIEKEGRFYSTIDSAAGIAAITAVQKSGIAVTGSDGKVKINDQEMDLQQAISFPSEIQKVEAVEGIVIVEIRCQRQENLDQLSSTISQRISYSLERDGNIVNLKVVLERYEPGLLLHYQLPPCLRRQFFGGKVSAETIDFKGRKEIEVPLGINGEISGQHWRLLVRNMFKEEEVWNPGLQRLEL